LRQTGGSTAVCRCEEGQFWDTAIMKCGACPADTYSSTDNTLYDGEDPATAGIRTWCSPCVELTVSAPGSTSKDDCKPAYALLSATKDNNGFCSQSDENLPLIPILDAAECQTAADSLGLAVASAGLTEGRCQDMPACAKHIAQGNKYVQNKCKTTKTRVKDDADKLVFMAELCKVSCNTCLRGSDIGDTRPIGCALDQDTNQVVLYPKDLTENSLFWDGKPFSPICKSLPCRTTRGFEDVPNYARTREETSTCELSADARKLEEDEQYKVFYITVVVLVLIIEISGGVYLLRKETIRWQDVILIGVVGMRSFDMCSDWAFYSISLREGGSFAVEYGGDFDTLRECSLAFCILGLFLWIPDMYAYVVRTSGDEETETDGLFFTMAMTISVMVIEDFPQLIMNIIYLSSTGFGGADGIAVFSFVMSLFSILSNVCLLAYERSKHLSGGQDLVFSVPVTNPFYTM